MEYAGFWNRLAACVIDSVIVIVVYIILSFAKVPGFDFNTTGAQESSLSSLLPFLLNWLYFALMESSAKQGTLGKLAMRLKVTNLAGEKISFAKATGRYFGKFVSALIFCIGFIMVAFTTKKQGLHDKMAETLVYLKKD